MILNKSNNNIYQNKCKKLRIIIKKTLRKISYCKALKDLNFFLKKNKKIKNKLIKKKKIVLIIIQFL